MYFYIIDNFIKEKRYARIYHRMTMQLNDLGIFDDKIQVTKVRPIEDIVRDVLSSRNIEQIIAVGNDSTASKVINAICKHPNQENTPAFGIIPFETSDIADCLGFSTNVEDACSMISRRKIDKIDIGKANKDYFLTTLSIQQSALKNKGTIDKIKNIFIKGDEIRLAEIQLALQDFKITSTAKKIDIINIYTNYWKKQLNNQGINLKKISPHDGLANLLISNNLQKDADSFSDISFFTTKNITINTKEKIFAYLDNIVKVKTPIEVTIKMKYFKALLGKNRHF